MPSGAGPISIDVSVTVARPATSMSSIRSGHVPGTVPGAWPKESGSKPLRSVKRHASSRVVGSGSARERSSRSALDIDLAVVIRLVAVVEHQRVAVGILEQRHVAHPRVDD